MYGIRGERRLSEVTLDWLKGYQGARPSASATAPIRSSSSTSRRVRRRALDQLASARRAHAVGARDARGAGQDGVAHVAAPGSRDLGDARARPLVHRVQDFCLGHGRPLGQGDRDLRARGRQTALGNAAPDHLRRGLRQRLRPHPQHVHAVLRLGEPRRQLARHLLFDFLPSDDPRLVGTVRAIERICSRMVSSCATAPTRATTGSSAKRACSSPARSGSPTPMAAWAATTTPSASSSA